MWKDGYPGTAPEFLLWKQSDGHFAVHYIVLYVLDILGIFSSMYKIIQNKNFKGK